MQKPDVFAQSIRLSCGALFGLFAGLYATCGGTISGEPFYIILMAGAMIAGAYLSNRLGDEFWENWRAFLYVLLGVVLACEMISELMGR